VVKKAFHYNSERDVTMTLPFPWSPSQTEQHCELESLISATSAAAMLGECMYKTLVEDTPIHNYNRSELSITTICWTFQHEQRYTVGFKPRVKIVWNMAAGWAI